MQPLDEAGQPLDATFSVESTEGELSVVFESRGGGKGKPGAKNTQYAAGLESILERLKQMDARITDAVLDTRETQRRQLSRAERQLALEGVSYPIVLARQADLHDLRLRLGRAQERTGRTQSGKKGGNPTKRIRLYIALASAPSAEEVEWRLGQPASDPALDAVVEAIEKVAGKRGRHAGQGFSASKEVRDVVEKHAMSSAQAYYEAAGWTVDASVAATECFDLRCTHANRPELRVEVKGTSSDGAKLLLTRNEVSHARQRHPHIALFVLSGIKLERSADAVSASGGVATVFEPWAVDEGSLSALAFEYVVPPLPGRKTAGNHSD